MCALLNGNGDHQKYNNVILLKCFSLTTNRGSVRGLERLALSDCEVVVPVGKGLGLERYRTRAICCTGKAGSLSIAQNHQGCKAGI